MISRRSSDFKLPDFLKREYSSHHAQLIDDIDSDGFATIERKSRNFFS